MERIVNITQGRQHQNNPTEILRQYAVHLSSIRRRGWFSRPFYEIMSDALVWRNETTASTPTRLVGALRPLFHHRTGLILGEQWRFAEEWQLGLRLFPHWVGFHPSRCRPSRRLAEIYRASKADFQRDLDQLERGQR